MAYVSYTSDIMEIANQLTMFIYIWVCLLHINKSVLAAWSWMCVSADWRIAS